MKAGVLRHTCAALVAAIMVFFSGFAAAASAPKIAGFESAPVDELAPGTDLAFRVTGTPGAQVTVRVPGIKQPIRLTETRSGVYEGSYTIKRGDQPPPAATARATLRRQNVAVTARLGTPLAGSTATASATPAVQRFMMEPRTIEPGAELTFTLQGTPGGKAAVNLGSTGRAVALTETQPGVYEGTYTVRRQDRFTQDNVTATLQAEKRTVRVKLPDAAAGSAHIQNVSPREGERVAQPLTISGSLASNVDPRSVRVLFGNTDVTRDATVTTNGFTYRPPQPVAPGNYRVEVLSSDYSGASARAAWNISVQQYGSAQAAPAPAVTTIEFLSPGDQTQIGKGPIEIRGRSAANATFNVHVNAMSTLPAIFGGSRILLARQVQTDSRGNFAFVFDPRDDQPTGTRYEVIVDGTLAGEHKQTKLTLVQQ